MSDIATDPRAGFELVIGLEVHVQLETETKIFCACSTDFGRPPNANSCPVCLGLPGALPVLNRRAVWLAMRAAIALGCEVQPVSVFARKNYFYPDLPKGYQISQFDRPLALRGGLEIAGSDGARARIGITRVHMEEDAGKSVHDRFAGWSAIDLNRAGVPLIEIVSEPDMRSAAQAGAYLRLLRQTLDYARVSDLSMEKGSLRVDANVSARPRGASHFGTKTEVKNLNSFSAVERAIDVEFARQCAILTAGGTITQQTLLWDERAQTVRPARSKEESHDYRYFPDPDLPPLVLDPAWIDEARASLPELPAARHARMMREHGLSAYDVDVLTATALLADYAERVIQLLGDAKAAANFVMGEVLATLKMRGEEIDRFPVGAEALAELLTLVRDGTLSSSGAKQVLALMIESGEGAAVIVEREGLAQVSDDARLAGWIDEVLAEHPDEGTRFLAGERKLVGVLVGAVMRKSGGRADPRRVNQLLVARIGS